MVVAVSSTAARAGSSLTVSFSKLNLGCGDDYRAGYHNIDIRPEVDPDEVVNLDEFPWPWPDDAYEVVLASHVIEHLSDQHRALRELSRIAEPGGIVRIRSPHWNSASTAIDPTHKQPLDPRTLEHELAPDWRVVDVEYLGVRGAQLLPERVAVWLADMVGHFVIEWTATVQIPEADDEN